LPAVTQEGVIAANTSHVDVVQTCAHEVTLSGVRVVPSAKSSSVQSHESQVAEGA
jgi:hypothetical protein